MWVVVCKLLLLLVGFPTPRTTHTPTHTIDPPHHTTPTPGFDWEPPAQQAAGRAVPVTPDNVEARATAFMEAVGNKSRWCVACAVD